MKKLLFIVLDGASDLPIKELGNKTPLEVAYKPNINNLSRMGENGLMNILPIPPESDEAVLSLLGYDVFDVYTGRGPLEAVGGGVPFKDGDVAIRCNMGSLVNGKITDVRAGHISTEEAKELEWAINEYVKLDNAEFIFKSTMNYRGVLVIKAKGISSKISNTHPGYAVRPIQVIGKEIPISAAIRNPVMEIHKAMPLERTKAANLAADIVNEFIRKSSQVMENHPVNIKRKAQGKHPANIILTRDAGDKIPKLYNFSNVYGTKWACFAEMPVERGISQLSGMETIPMPEPGIDPRKNYIAWAQTLIRNLQFYDAMYIHLKGPDVFAHIGDYKGKIKSIEDIDKYFFGPILKRVDMQNTMIVITCDHTTSCDIKAHTEHAVPLTIVGPDIVPDNVPGFWESSCAEGSIKNIDAIDLMPMLIKMMKR